MKTSIHIFKKRFRWATLVLLVLAVSCSQETVLDTSENLEAVNASANNGKRVERPWKVRSSGRFAPDFSINCEGLLPLKIEGSGEASHVGHYNITITWCTGGIGTPDNFITGISTAANGDKIFYESILFGIENGVDFVDYVVTGGTGRFTGASGSLRSYTTEFTFENDPTEPPRGTFANEGEGVLVY